MLAIFSCTKEYSYEASNRFPLPDTTTTTTIDNNPLGLSMTVDGKLWKPADSTIHAETNIGPPHFIGIYVGPPTSENFYITLEFAHDIIPGTYLFQPNSSYLLGISFNKKDEVENGIATVTGKVTILEHNMAAHYISGNFDFMVSWPGLTGPGPSHHITSGHFALYYH